MPPARPDLDPRFVAGVNLLGRTGAKSFQIRYDEEQDPLVWVAVGEWDARILPPMDPEAKGTRFECAGGLHPVTAVVRLLERVVDGGSCTHCGKPTGLSDDWTGALPFEKEVCWYVFDPEMKVFRRSCEGEPDKVGRNDPCPCGSGAKWKKCHGRGR